MKLLLLLISLTFGHQAFAQESNCSTPNYFPGLSSLLNRKISDVLIGLQEDSTLKYYRCFRGDSDHPDWVFIAYRSDLQQITFVFVQDRVNMILLDGAPCPCLKELEHLTKWWIQQADKARYINKDGTAEAVIDINRESDCLSIKTHQ